MPSSNSRFAALIPSSPRNTARYTNKDGTKVITVSRTTISGPSSATTADPASPSAPSSAAARTIAATAAASTAAAPQKPSSTAPSAAHDNSKASPTSDSPMPPASAKKAKKRQAAKSAKTAAAPTSSVDAIDAAARDMAPSVRANAASAASAASTIPESGHSTQNANPNHSAGLPPDGISPETGISNHHHRHHHDDDAHSPATTSSDHLPQPASKKNKKRKKKTKKTASVADSNDAAYLQHGLSHGQDYAANGSLAHSHGHSHAHAHSHHHHNHHHQHSLPPRDDQVWDINPHEDRERIKEFWLNLDEKERKSLVRLEKETVLKKMKDQQKNTCTCNVCGRKRTAIERELEGLYDSYYRELEQYAQEGSSTPFLTDAATGSHDFASRRHPPMPSAFPRTPAAQSRMIEHVNATEEYDDDDDLDEDAEDDEAGSDEDLEYDDDGSVDPRGQPQRQPDDLVAFGQSLQVKEGILTVADDLLRNDGKRFIEMMEKLAERRMAREDSSYPSPHSAGDSARHGNVLQANGVNYAPPVDHDHGFEDGAEAYEDEGEEGEEYDDEEDAEDEEEEDEEELDEHQTEEQRMAEGRKMFQIFAARMFEQRVLSAYRKKLSADRSAKLMEELDKEERDRQEREAAKAAKQQRKREKERAKKQAAAEAKARKEAEKAAEEAAKKAEKEAQAAKTRAKAEEKRKAKEAQRRAEEEERQRKEAERLHRIHEQERKNKEAKERQNKLREENRLKEKEAREAKEKEKEKKEREAKEKQEAEAAREKEEKEKQAKAALAAATAAAAAAPAPAPAPTPTPALAPAAVAASASLPTAPATHPVTPSKPRSAVPATTPARTPIPAVARAPSSVVNTPSTAIGGRKPSAPPGLYNTLPSHGPNPIATTATYAYACSPKNPVGAPTAAANAPSPHPNPNPNPNPNQSQNPAQSSTASQQLTDSSSSSALSGSQQASGAPSQNASPLVGSSIHTSPSPMSSSMPPHNGMPPVLQNNNTGHHFGGLPISPPSNSSGLKGIMPVDQFLGHHQSTVTAPPPGLLSASSLPPGLGLYNNRPIQEGGGMYPRYGSVDGLQAPPGLGMPPMKSFSGPPPGLGQPYEPFNSLPIGSNSFGMQGDALQSAFSHGRQSSGSFDLSALGITNGFYHKPAPIGRPGSVAHSNRSNSTSQEDVNEHLGSRALLDDQDEIIPSPAPRPRVGSGAPGLVRPAGFSTSPFIEAPSAFSLGGYSPWTASATSNNGFAPPAGIWGSSATSATSSLGFPGSVSAVNSLPARRKMVTAPTLRRYMAAACQAFREAGQTARDGFVDYDKLKRHVEMQLGVEVSERDVASAAETLGNPSNGGGAFECRELAPGLRVIRWEPPMDMFLNQYQKPMSREPLDHVLGHGLGRV